MKCVPDPNGGSAIVGLTILDVCNAEPNGCAAGLWCRDYETCFSDTIWGDSYCVVGSPQNGYCDSEWDDPGCFPCMPRSTCWNERCHVECEEDEDCPCDDGGEHNNYVCHDGLCTLCKSLGEPCDEHSRCCDINTQCGENAGPASTGPTPTTCCRPINGSCNSDSDCCAYDDKSVVCTSQNVCIECVLGGGTCYDDHDCCSKSCNTTTNECNPPACAKSGACTLEGQEGVCKKGHWECPSSTSGPECQQDNYPTDEVCNGKDDDCDGSVDEGLGIGETCSGAHPPECQDGFTTTGKIVCSVEGPVCHPIDYCKQCDGNANGCGKCYGQGCSTDADCAVNSKCVNDGPSGMQCKTVHNGSPVCPSSPLVECYTPDQGGTCL